MTAPLAGDGVSPAPVSPDGDARWKAPPIVRGVRAAFALLTRVPVGGHPYESAALAWAAGYAPLVGLVLGSALGALDYLLLPLGELAAATLVLGASMLLTGALHEDGLADTSDALGGAYHRAQVFAILKDSRIGSFGAAAVAVSVVARASLIGRLGESALWALPLTWCAARVGPVWLMATMPYVTPQSDAKNELVARARVAQALLATLWFLGSVMAASSAGCITPQRAGTLALTLGVVTCLTGWRYWQRAGGVTGDFLGATEQLGEVGALVVLAWTI